MIVQRLYEAGLALPHSAAPQGVFTAFAPDRHTGGAQPRGFVTSRAWLKIDGRTRPGSIDLTDADSLPRRTSVTARSYLREYLLQDEARRRSSYEDIMEFCIASQRTLQAWEIRPVHWEPWALNHPQAEGLRIRSCQSPQVFRAEPAAIGAARHAV